MTNPGEKRKPGIKKGTKLNTAVRRTIQVTVDEPKPKKRVAKPGSKPIGNPAFQKGNKWAFKPGDPRINYSGRPKGTGLKRISEAYNARLTQEVPPEVAEALGFDPEHPVTWSEALAAGMIQRAVTHDTTAAKELREVTEGRLPDTLNLEGHIDYSAGQSAKELLLAKLKPSDKQS